MSLICNTGRPPKDDALQNLTVNDTLRVNNLIKATRAEIERLCATDELVPLVIGGALTMILDGGDPAALDLSALPSGTSSNIVRSAAATVANLWYTSQDLIISKFQVAAVSADNTTLNVAVGVTSDPAVAPTDVLTVALPLTASTVALDTDVSDTVLIPAGSFVTIHVTSSTTTLEDVRVSWTLHLNP
jgi:hypothetical protein